MLASFKVTIITSTFNCGHQTVIQFNGHQFHVSASYNYHFIYHIVIVHSQDADISTPTTQMSNISISTTEMSTETISTVQASTDEASASAPISSSETPIELISVEGSNQESSISTTEPTFLIDNKTGYFDVIWP